MQISYLKQITKTECLAKSTAPIKSSTQDLIVKETKYILCERFSAFSCSFIHSVFHLFIQSFIQYFEQNFYVKHLLHARIRIISGDL